MKSFAEIKAEMGKEHAARNEKIREAARNASAVKTQRTSAHKINGVCPKCGTYCYGDCQSH